jgi:hypothetical protein
VRLERAGDLGHPAGMSSNGLYRIAARFGRRWNNHQTRPRRGGVQGQQRRIFLSARDGTRCKGRGDLAGQILE